MGKRIESWDVTDEFWQRVEPLIPQRVVSPDKVYLRKPGAGRPPKPLRQVFEGIVYVLRTGCQWKALPKERESGQFRGRRDDLQASHERGATHAGPLVHQ